MNPASWESSTRRITFSPFLPTNAGLTTGVGSVSTARGGGSMGFGSSGGRVSCSGSSSSFEVTFGPTDPPRHAARWRGNQRLLKGIGHGGASVR